MKGGFVAKTIVDEQLSEAVIPRFANLKRREKKNPANFNVAKFNILLYSLFSQFNEETYVYVLCIMCKSFMACLQMTNNSLTVTVKFHYLRCFDLFVCITIVVFRSFQHLFCTVIEMTLYLYNLKRQPVYSF